MISVESRRRRLFASGLHGLRHHVLLRAKLALCYVGHLPSFHYLAIDRETAGSLFTDSQTAERGLGNRIDELNSYSLGFPGAKEVLEAASERQLSRGQKLTRGGKFSLYFRIFCKG
jgi:hypothetical protein